MILKREIRRPAYARRSGLRAGGSISDFAQGYVGLSANFSIINNIYYICEGG